MTRCAAVLPCRNEARRIAAVLEALAGQTRPPDEVVIVDDCSTDGTADAARAWQAEHGGPPLRVIEGPGRGPGPAMNAGIRQTTAEVIMRMDGHAVPAAGYLAHCLEGLADPAVGVVGGVWHIRPGAETTMARAIAAVTAHPLGSGGAQYRHGEAGGPERIAVETVPFGTFRRAVWERVGGFDDALTANEDFDFNDRVRQAGFQVILDRRVKSTYYARPTLQALARQYFRYGYWKVRMLRKRPGALHPRQVPPALVLPWVVTTFAALIAWPGWITAGAVGLYPVLLIAGSLHVAVSRVVNPLAVFVAAMTVHVAWSAGFWTSLLARRSAEG